MKKKLSFILAVSLMLCMALAVSACGGAAAPAAEETVTESAPPEEPVTEAPAPEEVVAPEPEPEPEPVLTYTQTPVDGVYMAGFREGLAAVATERDVDNYEAGLWRYVDKSGATVIEERQLYSRPERFSSGLAVVWPDSKNWNYLKKDGTYLMDTKSTLDWASDFYKDNATAIYRKNGGGYPALIDKNGTITPLEFGFDWFSLSSITENVFSYKNANTNKWGLIALEDTDTPTYYPLDYDAFLWWKGNGYIPFAKNGKLGFVNYENNVVIDFIYDLPNEERISTSKDGSTKGEDFPAQRLCYFNNGMFNVIKDGKYGYIDEGGNVLIDFKYDDAGAFAKIDPEDGSKMLATVRMDGKYGFIDRDGNIVIDCLYDYSNGIDHLLTTGISEKETDFDDKDPAFDFALAAVLKDGKWGVIDMEGNTVVPFEYDEMTSVNTMAKDGQWYILDYTLE